MVRQTYGDVEFGVFLPRWGDHATPDAFERVARTAEEAGYDAVWRSDHVTFPAEVPAELYPFGDPSFHVSQSAHDSFQVLSYLASITDRVKLGMNVCVVPYRHPVLLAKLCLTLASLSEGRFELGVGSGWLRNEFEVLDVSFEERGSRTDEFLDIFEHALAENDFAFDGPHHQFQRTGFYPTPAPGDEPPIWVGGRSPAAFRRVAEYGDGWTIVGDSPDEIRSARERIDRAWDDYDRDGDPAILSTNRVRIDPDATDDPRPMVGSREEVRTTIEEYVDAGVTHFVLDVPDDDADEQVRQIREIGELVADQ